MAPSLKLSASVRETTGKRSRHLRHDGVLPAVLYGHQSNATAIALNMKEFQTVYARAGRTHLVDVEVDGGRAVKVLIREVQTHPRRLGPVHVDLYRVSLREKLQAEVPVILTGESPVVKLGDADLAVNLHTVKVECLPADIPESIVVDVSGLEEIDAAIRLGELVAPEGVTILGDPEELVVKVAVKRVVAEEEEVAAAEGEGEAPAEGEAAAPEGESNTDGS